MNRFVIFLFLFSSIVNAQYFAVNQEDGRWWFNKVNGEKYLALGVNHAQVTVRFKENKYVREFGKDRQKVFSEVGKDLKSWGFNSGGYDAPAELRNHLPSGIRTSMLHAAFYHKNLGFKDLFSEGWLNEVEMKAKKVCASVEGDKNFLAHFFSDCISWNIDFANQRHGTDFVKFFKQLPDSAPGKKVYESYVKEKGSDKGFLRIIARQYYSSITKAFRKYGKGQLIGGDALKLREVPDEVLEEVAKYVDIVSIQVGDHHHALNGVNRHKPDETWFDRKEFDRIYAIVKKPIIICDHQCGFYTDRTPKTGMWYQYPSEKAAAESYDQFLKSAFDAPYIIGYFRCQFLSVWKDDKKIFKQGLIDKDGIPFNEYLKGVSSTNKAVLKALDK